MKPDRTGIAAVIVGIGMSLALLVMLGRVAQLQIAPTVNLSNHIEPRISVWKETPVRGDLIDRRGRPLSVTRFGYRVLVDPTLLPADLQNVVAQLEEASGLPAELIRKRISDAQARNKERAERAAAGQIEPELLPEDLALLTKEELAAYEASRKI